MMILLKLIAVVALIGVVVAIFMEWKETFNKKRRKKAISELEQVSKNFEELAEEQIALLAEMKKHNKRLLDFKEYVEKTLKEENQER